MPDSPQSSQDQRQFQILNCLGVGGFGEVYLAKMTSAGGVKTDVALKVLHRGLDPRSQAVQRLRDEGQLLGMLNHPGILKVHDMVLLEGRAAMATEYVPGADLDVCAQDPEHPLTGGAAMEVFAQVADALNSAFVSPGPDGSPLSLLHRDIKPSNIRVGRHGAVKLLDFGIAKAAVDREAKTQTNAVIGSLHYMAPERYDDSGDHPSSDVYSLGCTLYEVIAGKRLFPDLTVKQHYAMALAQDRHDLHVAACLEALEEHPAGELLGQMLKYEPQDRPPLADLANHFEDLAEATGGPRLTRWCRAHPWPEPSEETGELSGKTITEASLALNTGQTGSTTMHIDLEEEIAPAAEEPVPETAASTPEPAVPSGRKALAALFAVGGGGVIVMLVGMPLIVVLAWLGANREPPQLESPSVDDPVPTQDVVDEVPDEEEPDQTEAAPAPPSELAILQAKMRDENLKQTDRDAAGRWVLAEGWTQCEAGSCGLYETEQRYFFEAISRSDADLLTAWSAHLETTSMASAKEADLKEAITWSKRALELKNTWQGTEYVDNVQALHGRLGQLSHKRWKVAEAAGDPRDTYRRKAEAKTDNLAWLNYLNQLGFDASKPLALCTEAAGSEEACLKQAHEVVDVMGVTFVSVPMGAMVYIDGVQLGPTPTIHQVSHGAHDIEMRSGDTVGQKTVTVGLGEPVRWSWRAVEDDWTGGF